MVEISCGWEGRERGWGRVSRGATLVGGHVCRLGWGRRPNSEHEKYGRGDRAQNDMVFTNVGGGKKGSGSV